MKSRKEIREDARGFRLITECDEVVDVVWEQDALDAFTAYEEREDKLLNLAKEMLSFCRDFKCLLDDDADIIEGDFAFLLKEFEDEKETTNC